MLKFIENVGEYFSSNYFDDDFAKRVLEKSGHASEQFASFNKQLSSLREPYYKYKRRLLEERLRTKDKIWETHTFHNQLLKSLGFADLSEDYQWVYLNDHRVVPVRHTLVQGHQPHLMVLEMQPLIPENADDVPDSLFEQRYALEDDDSAEEAAAPQRYLSRQWERVWQKPTDFRIEPSVVNKVVSSIFLLKPEERPRYVLLLAGNVVFLLEQEKWFRGSYLRFDLEELFSEAAATSATRNYYSVLYFLLGRETLAPNSERLLLDQLDEDSHRNAYAVTVDLKQGVIQAVEALANEAIWYRQHTPDPDTFDTADSDLAAKLKDDCLTVVYRLLFLFYAEARPDLNLLPTNDTTYLRGYSLEMLRDLEQVPLVSEATRHGYFFDESLKRLFSLLHTGWHEADASNASTSKPRLADKHRLQASFAVRRLDSPLFDNSRLTALQGVRFRNEVWQSIVQQLSLTKQQANRSRGRISYANLGVNQLGSVYESLLAFRGFFAQEDLLEVHPAGKPKEASYLVARSRRDDFRDNEIKRDEHSREIIISKGRFVYRLSGRDRQRSASYYTPEVLTRCTVRYTLQPLLERLDLPEGDKNRLTARDLLDLRLLEPAMGAAAFHNELVNQLAEAYLSHRQQETGKRVPPDRYQEELQKVKAYLATHNVYGVDLNPTAVELGKLSLWLNAMHPQMETPFFGHRLAVGNAVVGAWLQVYAPSDVRFELPAGGRASAKPLPKPWWEKAPRPVSFTKKGPKRETHEIYHFLLPDPQMVAAADAKEIKAAYPNEVKHVREWRKAWKEPLRAAELDQVQHLCRRVDELLVEHYRFELTLRRRTEGRDTVWEAATRRETQLELLPYAEKERLATTRHRHGAPYFKLKVLLDYWCALWFWDVRRAADLPTRQQWWADLAELLGTSPAPARLPRSLAPSPQLPMFGGAGVQLPLLVETEPESLVAGPPPLPDDAPEHYEARRPGLFEQAPRLPLVQALAERHRFFHPQLEFLEVFWEHGGFDVIVGNPPWLKVQFEAQDLVGESFPEVFIRKTSAPQVRAKLDGYLRSEDHRAAFEQEVADAEATATFLNAYANYPLLAGQQTNLYKCVLENGFRLLGPQGFMGLLHPESVYDDPNGQPLRREMYQRLRYHFQFQNAFNLFAEVAHREKFGTHVYAGTRHAINFDSINNLFHPDTVPGCFVENEHAGPCGGIKLKDEASGEYVWNTRPHPKRRVQITREVLQIIDDTFEGSGEPQTAKLVGIHSVDIISVLQKLAGFSGKVGDAEIKVSQNWHETYAVEDGNIVRNTTYPNVDAYEMVYSGPHFFVSNPIYKTPRKVCVEKGDYDIIDLQLANADTIARTNYVPPLVEAGYADTQPGFQIGIDDNGKPRYDSWFGYYKLGFRKMLSQAGERTLTGAILPPKTAHINLVNSVTFRDQSKLIEAASLCSSLVMDFFVKSSGRSDLYDNTIRAFPLGIAARYKPALFIRTLLLNCVNHYYADLWTTQWQESYQQDAWSQPELPGLYDLAMLEPQWTGATPLRTWQARRLALVEIDVLAAQALGLTLDELILIYEVQFPVLQQNEDDTWYDQRGNIVFTCSKGLIGIGLDRPSWERVRHRTAQGEPVTHTLTSELYAGTVVHYYPPFVKCDRVEDYRVAWAHFEATLCPSRSPVTAAKALT